VFELGGRQPIAAFLQAARAGGVLLGATGGRRIRAVTHYGITAEDCRLAAGAIAAAVMPAAPAQ
jgi:regulator of extracellular matrix RemA (YlzA/DUF370 family)